MNIPFTPNIYLEVISLEMNSFTGTSSHIQVHTGIFYYYCFASITRKIENNDDTFKSYN